MFTKAVKYGAKLRLSIAGPSGSGKTYSALAIATALSPGKVALLDTEHGSASKYADLFDFDVLELSPPYHPDRYVQAIKDAAKAGYEALVLDSLSHAWDGEGGLLEIVDQVAKRMKTTNTFAAWKDATPIQNRLVESIVGATIHVIATMRSKQEYIIEEDAKGRSRPRKVGMAPRQRDGFEYEFDVFAEMDLDNNLIVSKTRCPALSGGVFAKPGADVAKILGEWLNGVEPPPPKAEPATTQAAEDSTKGATQDEYVLPRGPHKGKRLVEVPEDYLEELLDKTESTPASRPMLEMFQAELLRRQADERAIFGDDVEANKERSAAA